MENILFSMPSDGEAFLAALAAVQAWVREQADQVTVALAHIADTEQQADQAYAEKKLTFGRYQMLQEQIVQARAAQDARKLNIHVHLVAHFDNFRPAFGDVTFVDKALPPAEISWPVRGAFDMIFAFDPSVAFALGSTTQRHMAQAFGIMIGAECGSLPDLSKLVCVEEEPLLPYDVLLLPNTTSSAVLEFVQRNRPGCVVHEMLEDDPAIFQEVCRADVVVGLRSYATYLACALGKRVVELYPDDKYKRWLSKWDNPNYSMVYGDEFPPALVYRAMEQLWNRPRKDLIRPVAHDLIRKRTALSGLSAAMAEGKL